MLEITKASVYEKIELIEQHLCETATHHSYDVGLVDST